MPKRKYFRRIGRASPEGGFAMAYSVLIVVTMLAIALSVSSVILRRISISGLERDSLAAFYVADTGAECALHEDVANNAFGTPAATLSCRQISVAKPAGIPLLYKGYPAQDFVFDWNFPDNTCVKIRVIKYQSTSTVISRGYNDCTGGPGRKLERAVEIEYQT